MTSFNNISFFELAVPTLLLLIIGFTTSCTLTGVEEDLNSSISEEDLEAASEILGEALSSDNSGLVLSLNDALTTASSDGFTSAANSTATFRKTTAATLQDDDSGIGRESNYSYSYDPETGIHTISFLRSISRPLFSKEVVDTLKYIFTDNNNAFIQFPRQEKERIESIDYNSYREGSVETPRKTSSFVRTDTMIIDGVSSASSILQIDGVHNSEGQVNVERPSNNNLERSYQLEINFLNIEIDKEASKDGLEQGVTGTLSWEMIIEKNDGENGSTKTLRGTVEMNGDGTALLRFKNFLKVFNVNLRDGDVKDRDHEFEGRVVSVNLDRQSFTLRSGYEIFVDDQTEFDDDFTTLRQVQDALQNGFDVWAEGEGYRQNERFTATEVEFEREDDDDGDQDDEGREFEARVSSVNLSQSTFTIFSGVVFKVNDRTSIDDDSDYQLLEEVSEALRLGYRVKAEGEAVVTDDPAADVVAVELSFESDQDGGDSDDDDDDED